MRLSAQAPALINGVANPDLTCYALVNANIHSSHSEFLPNATLIVRNSKIETISTSAVIPKDAVIINCNGKHIYPALIDCWSKYGVIQAERKPPIKPNQFERGQPGVFNWNMAIKPEINAADLIRAKSDEASSLRKQGFGAVFSHQADGISRGTGSVISLADGKESDLVIKQQAGTCFSFDKGTSSQDYPSSLMGAIALLRQTYLDADWYSKLKNENFVNRSLESFNQQKALPAYFETHSWQDLLRADRLGDEFGVQYILKSAGDEYEQPAAVKATGATLIIPLNFPEAWDLSDAYTASYVPLSVLRRWEMAPSNAAIMQDAGVPFAITSSGLKDLGKFWEQLNKAVDGGLSPSAALKALTESPARLLGIQDLVGSLKPGKMASFFISSDTLFSKENRIWETWVQGKRYPVESIEQIDIRGQYDFKSSDELTFIFEIVKKSSSPECIIKPANGKSIQTTFNRSGNRINILFQGDDISIPGTVILNGYSDTFLKNKTLVGRGILPSGKEFDWQATLLKAYEDSLKIDSIRVEPKDNAAKIWYPNSAFGSEVPPMQETVLISNATVWTNELEGKLENASVIIHLGKILAIGKNLKPEQFLPKGTPFSTIDGTGKHVTAGIVDEHSHIAISNGVNEGTQNNTAEVRIGDVLDPTDIHIYQQLAGGVTAAQLLHGSANPIGGQSALIKLRWGTTPEGLKIKNAPEHIKFALGENVKQSNWGDRETIRFPQTRMGVEQVYFDAFERAKEYREKRASWNALSDKQKRNTEEPRKDLELDALVEILENKRFITCHSYVQSEINMLMHVADSMGFRVNTFTHILEGYKVADKMKARGINGSSFSDWWAYKWEVMEAIPYNGAILSRVGVNTGFNSDDAEMARRLNQEAAKAVLYGNISEEEALKFVTLNPAKMLHIDGFTGSIKMGKDADLVVWTDHPLSIYAKAQQTFVDGIRYFDLERDEKLQKEASTERARITQKMLSGTKGSAQLRKPVPHKRHEYECEDLFSGDAYDIAE